jgi:uncharacterized protein (DUF2252 family)
VVLTGESMDASTPMLPAALLGPVPTRVDRLAEGKRLRKVVPRQSHAAWEPAVDRFDPVEVLVESNRLRLPDLVPLRHRRMLESPFAFLRGSALVMAHDLATTPSAGITVQLCGDAHLLNFGVFASPERTLVFDLNDFDETWPGPFEWDVKRLAASAFVACQENGMDDAAARVVTMAAVASYRTWMQRYSEMTHLEVWYAMLDARTVLDLFSPSDRRVTKRKIVDKALTRNHEAAVTKLTKLIDGRRSIVPDPPLVTRVDEDRDIAEQLPNMIEAYRQTLAPDRRALFDRYRLVDMARKVVGVGSVGTRCYILLFQGPNGGPLFLQAKEASASSGELAGLPGEPLHCGERVVVGQRLLQSASDVLLGWTTNEPSGRHYYIRQLWDAKGSADVAGMTPAALRTYAGSCGWALARAHARTADSVMIAGYLGNSPRFDEAITDFAQAYSGQTRRDHAALLRAAEQGQIPIAPAS